MQAKDIMTKSVITVKPDSKIRDIAKTLLTHRISAVPVVDSKGAVLGIVSEGDLMRRRETDTEKRESWWSALIASPEERAAKYVKTHGTTAEAIMTKPAVTVDENASLQEIAEILDEKRIKRVPVVKKDKVIGIVSRANLLQGLVAHGNTKTEPKESDRVIREKVIDELVNGVHTSLAMIDVVVTDGKVHYWGLVRSDDEKKALVVAAENIKGVKGVEDHTSRVPKNLGMLYG